MSNRSVINIYIKKKKVKKPPTDEGGQGLWRKTQSRWRAGNGGNDRGRDHDGGRSHEQEEPGGDPEGSQDDVPWGSWEREEPWLRLTTPGGRTDGDKANGSGAKGEDGKLTKRHQWLRRPRRSQGARELLNGKNNSFMFVRFRAGSHFSPPILNPSAN